jgi:hypothetical protein
MRNNGASQLSGTGYPAPTEIAIQADGSWYEVPVDVPRVGSNAGWHFGSRPARIPLRGAIHHLRLRGGANECPRGIDSVRRGVGLLLTLTGSCSLVRPTATSPPRPPSACPRSRPAAQDTGSEERPPPGPPPAARAGSDPGRDEFLSRGLDRL